MFAASTNGTPYQGEQCPGRSPSMTIINPGLGLGLGIARRELSCFGDRIVSPSGGDLVLGPAAGPPDPVTVDPVVRLAREAPVADGRAQRNRLSVEGQRPVGRTQWSDDLRPAPAAAQVDCCGEFDRRVENAFIQDIRYGVDEIVSKGAPRCHAWSSLMRVLVSMAYALKRSCSRSL